MIRFHLAVEIDLVEVVYYFNQVFHLLYDKGVTPAEALLFHFVIDSCILYDDIIKLIFFLFHATRGGLRLYFYAGEIAFFFYT